MGPTVTDPLVGRLIDERYEVVSRIARGGMATVYRAVDRRLERDVAIKVMHPHLADATEGGDFVARFRREARTVARLVHPGLVQVFDQGVDGDTVYLAMEYVDGVNLRHRMRQQGPPELSEVFDIAEKVLDALSAAHHAGLVHRDIKPENILIASDGRVKLADFGLARAVTELTQASTGTILGTVAYLAPELISAGTCDTRTDVYAVGVVLYEMITGRQPFMGASPVHVAFQHVNHDVPTASDLVPWLPAEIDETIAAFVSRDPAERPLDAPAALDLVRRTRRGLDNATLSRSADLPVVHDTMHSADHQATEVLPDAKAGTVALPLGLGLTPEPIRTHADAAARAQAAMRANGPVLPLGHGPGPQPQPGRPGPPPEAPRRRKGPVVAAVAAVAAVIIGVMGWFVAGPGARAAVPSVTGLEQRDAADLLSSRHLKVTFDEEFDSSVEEGRAVSTDPGEGTKLPWGSVVTVIISKGPDWVAVPEGLIGADVTEAITAIEAAGLASVDPPVEAYSDDAPVGTVISVTLPDGSDAVAAGRAVRGAALTLSVSQGPAPVTMPSLTGLTVDEAEKRLADDDIALTTTTDWSSDVPKGQIISQDPGPGATVHRGDTVSVVVSDGVEMIAVPDVYHSGLSTARTTLEDAGFQVEVVHADQYYGLGFVVKQTPAAGTTAPRGTVVTLTVV